MVGELIFSILYRFTRWVLSYVAVPLAHCVVGVGPGVGPIFSVSAASFPPAPTAEGTGHFMRRPPYAYAAHNTRTVKH